MKYDILNVCSVFAVLVWITILIGLVECLIKKIYYIYKKSEQNTFLSLFKKSMTSTTDLFKKFKVLILVFIIGTISIFYEGTASMAFNASFGTPEIGAKIEKKNYNAEYYVLIYAQKSSNQNHRVKALIESSYDGERHYYIKEAYMEDGDKITFYNETYNNPLQIGQKVFMRDDSWESRQWGIELTDEKVN